MPAPAEADNGRVTSTTAARETSSATTRLVLAYVRQTRGEDAVARVLALADVPETREQLEDDSRWVSYRTRIRLFEAVAEEFGDPQVLFAVGGSLLHASVNRSMTVLLRTLGSPAQVFRQVPRAVAKFSTTSTMTVVEVGSTHATVDFRLHPGFEHSMLDCLYAQGLLTNVPALFGLPPAHIVHSECEQDGAPACRYHLTWERQSRWRRRPPSTELTDLRGQLQALQSAAADLAASPDVDTVLHRIVERAAATVLAQGYLLTVVPVDGTARVHSVGVPDADREALATRLRAGEDLGPSAVVVDIASTRHRYGRLAALYAEGQRGLPDERRLLAAYAGHAAAALDLLTALEDSRRDEDRARVLLELSHQLARATSTQDVCELVASALLRVVGCDSAGVLLWSPAAGELRSVSSVGLTPAAEVLLRSTPLRPQDVPELLRMLVGHEPLVLSLEAAQPALHTLMTVLELEHLVAVPARRGRRAARRRHRQLGARTGAPGADRRPRPAPAGRRRPDRDGPAQQRAPRDRAAPGPARRADRPAQPAAVRRPARAGARRRARRPCCSATSTASSRSTTTSATPPATSCCDRSPPGSRAPSVPGTAWRGCPGTSSPCCCPGRTPRSRAEVAAGVVGCFEQPFRLEGREVRATSSVGAAVGGSDAATADRLLRAADAAMYEAKQRGRNQVVLADGQALPAQGSGRSLGRELRDGLARGELRLVFQPVVALPHREVVGVEALVRWEHPRLGLLPPSAFLPLAEETGLSVELDLWVLRNALATVAAWPDGPPGVAVNLSSATLVDPRLLPVAREALASSGLPGSRLSLEVVESRALVDLPGVVDRLVALRRLGAQIALDDFGTGYSTLSLLQQLPATAVKVDRSFVSTLDAGDAGERAAARTLVRGVLALARALDLHVVAEGVETPEQLAVLQDEGCRFVQGYLLGRPAPAPGATAGPPRSR